MKRNTTITLSLLLALGMSSPVFAGESYGTQADTPMPQAANYQFSDADLEKFAAVQQDLDAIREEYAGKLETTEDPTEAQQLQQEASQTMSQAVQSKGLDIETYSSIAKAVRNDDALRQRVIEMIN